MDSLAHSSGDNNDSAKIEVQKVIGEKNEIYGPREETIENKEITSRMIEDNELKLKDRIAQCRTIIESLKIELRKDNSELKQKSDLPDLNSESQPLLSHSEMMPLRDVKDIRSDVYSTSVDSKLKCDDSLLEYELQLQTYQNTLNMAQIEKKNAIRKQMLAKAYRLKLLEVENQCNIELLRVKQSLQCLEPLKIIASKWTTADSNYDLDSYELIPRFPDLTASSRSDINNSSREDKASEKSGTCSKDDLSLSEC